MSYQRFNPENDIVENQRTTISSGLWSGGSATLTHVSGQTWKYVIVTGGSNNVTHPVMGVEMMFGGNGNMLDTGSISLSIS